MATNRISGGRTTGSTTPNHTDWMLADDSADQADRANANLPQSDSRHASERSVDFESVAADHASTADVAGVDALNAPRQAASESASATAAAQPDADVGARTDAGSDGPAFQMATWAYADAMNAGNPADMATASSPEGGGAGAGVDAAGNSGVGGAGSVDSLPVGGEPVGAPGAPGTLQTLADYLRVGFWNAFLGGASQRYYNIDDNGTGANFGTLYYNVTWSPDDSNGISAARAVLVREAFKLYGAVLGINFVETTSTSTSVDYFFGDNVAGQAYCYSQMYAGNSGVIDYSVVNVDSAWYGGSSTIGDYSFQTFIHEIGHGLGLGHQGNYNAGAGTPTYANSAIWENDSWQLTMMSYWDQVENTSASTAGATYAQLVSPMTVDWIALNNLYSGQGYGGVNFGTSQAFTGNTVWGVGTNISSATSAAFNGLAGFADSNAFTIVDGGGIDTVDFSNYAANQVINLNPASTGATNATLSSVGGYTGNMTIAVGTIIENAVGGSGNDTITGNFADNNLQGRGGNDYIDGGDGNDTVDGGTGADTLVGGFGDDLYIVDNLGDVAGEVAGGVDTVQSSVTHTLSVNLENLTLTGFAAINGTGNDSRNNVIIGNSGDNVLSGLAGNDTLYGGGGADTLYGGTGDDVLEGGFVTDTVYGEDGNDIIRVQAGEFLDNVYGGDGTDTLDHSASNYSGNTFDFEAGLISGGNTNSATAVLSSIEVYLDGSGGNTIVSDGNGNRYYGNAGDDYMIAEIGNEIMDGGVGGSDTIDLTRWSGPYTINMTTGIPVEWPGESFTNFENLISGAGNDAITGTAGSNVISTNGGNDSINGGGGADTINAGAGDDVITDANSGLGDSFDGGDGVDTLIANFTWVDAVLYDLTLGWMRYPGAGGTTYDTIANIENLTIGGGADVVGSASANVITILDTGFEHDNTIATGAGNDTIFAGIGNDVINAGSGNDSVDAGDGNDTITDTEGMGAADDDVYNGGAGIDTLVHNLNWSNAVLFDLTAGFSSFGGNRDTLISIENLTIGGSASINGSAVDNVLIALGTGANVINGQGGNDTIDAGGGNDTVDGGDGNDVIYGGDGNDSIVGSFGADTLYGGAGNDVLLGGFVTDDVYGEDGDDILRVLNGEFYDNSYGGNGTDTLDHSASTYSGNTFDFEAGLISGGNTNSATAVLSSIEVYLDGSGGNTIVSDGNGNRYYGNGGDDYMIAGLGDEIMDGGVGGSDTIDLTLWNGPYTLNMATGVPVEWPGESFTNFENLISGAGNDSITGTTGNNVIDTGAGNDTINAGAGNDTVIAGDGNDTIIDTQTMTAPNDDVYNGGAGIDTLVHDLNWASTVTFDLTAGLASYLGNRDTLIGIENLTVGGRATVIGSALDNVLIVNGTGANVINGAAGNDTIDAGGGSDTINGGSGHDSVVAGDGNDTIIDTEAMGASDDDVYDGGAGVDTLVHDLNWVSAVTFDLTAGFSSYLGNRDQLIGIENLTVGGSASVRGNALANVLIVNGIGANVINGEAGNDTINAGGGDDTINAGSGNDSVVAGDGNDTIIDTQSMNGTTTGDDVYNGGAGTDTLVHDLNWSNSVTFDLTAGFTSYLGNRDQLISIENLTVGGSATVRGNGQANVLIVNGNGANTINGEAGNDIINAGGGNDAINAGSGNDTVIAGDGNDTIIDTQSMNGTPAEDDVYNGGAGIDTLVHDLNWGSTVTFDLTAGFTSYLGNRDQLIGIENLTVGGRAAVRGDGQANVLTVNGTGANIINGEAGNDTINAGGGNDNVAGGDGADVLYGGAGNDTLDASLDGFEDRFVFDSVLNAANNIDTLVNAQFNQDQILLDNDIFTSLLSAAATNEGTLGAAFYFEGAGFTGNDLNSAVGIWYDVSSGGLYYNPTGNIVGDSIEFAIVAGAPISLARSDFTLFTDS